MGQTIGGGNLSYKTDREIHRFHVRFGKSASQNLFADAKFQPKCELLINVNVAN